MDVTRKNFKEKLNIVSECIDKSSFLAIDSEFTGLSIPGNDIHAFDTPEDRYRKLRIAASQFLLVQFGIAAFEYDSVNNGYIAKVFNFYIFPRPFSRQSPDVRFTCQSSSIDFLVSQGFDFNKVFREGIPYLLPPDEHALIDNLQQRHDQIDAQRQHASQTHFSSPAFTSPHGDMLAAAKGPSVIPNEYKGFIDDICKKIEAFLESEEEFLHLDPSNGYLRKLTYQSVTQQFPTGIHLEAKTNEKRMRYILVSKVSSEEEMKKREQAKRAAEFEEVDDAAGFSKVIKMISQSGKLMVGHNMLLDLLYILNQFVCPLPQEYEEFKDLVRCIFPRLLDTKLMATTSPIKELVLVSSLGDLVSSLEQKSYSKPSIVTAEGFPSYSLQNEKLHEAGYDSFITGIAFIYMSSYLGSFQKPPQCIIPPNSQLLSPFTNKIFLMRIHDIPYMNLAGEDLSPSRDHVFFVQFPREWKASDISQLFSPFGNVQIAWLDDASALVGLYKKDQASMVISHLGHTELYRVMSFSDYLWNRGSQDTVTPKQRPAKRKPSPVSDVDLPRKKRRSSSSEYSANRSMTTIPEEAASEDGDAGSIKRNKPNMSGNGEQKELDSVGPEGHKNSSTITASGPGLKLFVEPDNW